LADIFSKRIRSQIMSRISGKETKPEILVRKFLFSKGFRYRKNVKKLPGSPDVVLPKYRTVIFVNGCFWHGHESCRKANLPTSNNEFWRKKILGNKERDINNTSELRRLGWSVVVIWQCELRNNVMAQNTFGRLINSLTQKLPMKYDGRTSSKW
jgi:DNA mismatch endonuclease (patch repair protein)